VAALLVLQPDGGAPVDRMTRMAMACLTAAALIVSGGGTIALADATDPKADVKGAKDLPLLKRYEGSFIVDTRRRRSTRRRCRARR
jgi:hypothetical protein